MIPKLENRKWTVLESQYIAREGDWFTVRREKVSLPNGFVIPSWYIFEFPNWVNIIAITEDNQFVIIDQYRHAIGQTHYELVAGCVDKTDKTPMEAAQRELMEEAGFGGGEWEEFLVVSPNPTNHNNWSYTVLARNGKKISQQHAEPSEDIHVHLFSLEELKEMVAQGCFIQALHLASLYKFLYLNDK